MFEKQVQRLATARRQEAELKERRDKLVAAIEAMHPDLVQVREDLTAARDALDEADEQLRRDVLYEYRDTGEKPDHPALGVREYKAVRYPRVGAVKLAMRAGLSALLKLDEKAFEAVGPVAWPYFCDWGRTEAKATIARDLSRWAESGDGEAEPA